ncbi:MAG: murein L,D-transpeptidase [Verrucomicrobiae bacterium]|nr:murein L,D-transpeptidase [Verrucomicrobiae bacterium]
MLLLLVLLIGASWWAGKTGRIALPAPLQRFVKRDAGVTESAKPAKVNPPPKPISSLDFGTLPEPPPPLRNLAPAPLPPPVAATDTNVSAKPVPIPSQPSTVTKAAENVNSLADDVFKPRSAWSTFDVQIALSRMAISPGILDGLSGPQTTAAIKAFQEREGLEINGKPDLRTKSRLILNLPPYTSYVVGSNDVANLRTVGKTWMAKSGQDLLGYESVLELVAEKSHAYPRFIEQLNPKMDWRKVRVGDRVKVPLIQYPEPEEKAAFLRISLTNRTLQAFGARSNLLAHFPCSIAAKVEKRPVGELRVANFAVDPNYTFDPENFPESEEARRLGTKLTIPPGPNNPVGTAWIGLDKPGYGIHGTPVPEKIGRTESHGCFRLANWDASHLLKLVTKEMPVYVGP